MSGYPSGEGTSPLFDHSQCVPAGTGNARAHNHEGEKGRWLWPDDLKPDGTPKGLYDESPTGAGF